LSHSTQASVARAAPFRLLKRQAAISLDLDDLWTYLRAMGNEDWATAPSLLQPAADRLLPILDDLRLRITVFVVGRDALIPSKREIIQSFARAGHEIASHSFDHRPDLPHLTRVAIAEDVQTAEEAIRSACGTKPTGFRCPAYGISQELIGALIDAGYRYDASLFPTILVPALRLYHRTLMSTRGRSSVSKPPLYGRTSDAFLPLNPFLWRSSIGQIVEFPVTTLPLVRIPIHMSYIQALAERSLMLAQRYLRVAVRLCKISNVSPSFVLHPPDLLDATEAPALASFPGMSLRADAKIEQVRGSLELLNTDFQARTLSELVGALCNPLEGGAP